MLPRLVALDLDHTLLDGEGRISDANRREVMRVRGLGAHVVLATGKHPLAFADLARRLSLAGPHICLNGAALWRAGTWALDGEPLARGAAAAAMRTARELSLQTARFSARRIVAEPGSAALADALRRIGEPARESARPFRGATPCWKLLTLCAAGDAREAEARRRLSSRADVAVVRTSDRFVEFVPPNATKGRALRKVCDLLGVNLRDVIAVGDHMNDLDMLRAAGTGVTFTNAPEAVRRSADRVIPPGPEAVAGVLAAL